MRAKAPRYGLADAWNATLATSLVLGAVAMLWLGAGYYATPVDLRPDHAQHALLASGNGGGVLLGVLGTGLMLVMLLYSLRRWLVRVSWLGRIEKWLSFHIVCGIMGPVYILLHAGFKLPTGLIAVGFWCMIAVAASGVFGRYIYGFLPRMTNGNAVAVDEALGRLTDLRAELVAATADSRSHAVGEAVQTIRDLDAHAERLSDLWVLRRQVVAVRSNVRRLLAEAELDPIVHSIATRALEDQLRLRQGLGASRVALRMFRYWHLFHRPLASAMYVIVAVHVLLAVLFGDSLGRVAALLGGT
ncbi:MAG: hypothetical protein ACI8PZ_004919 [Myxococcota bacterium]